MTKAEKLVKEVVRTVPDWPEKGVMFRDITPIFQHPEVLHAVFEAFIERYREKQVDVIAGIDARGFLLGVTISYELKIPFVPVRKRGKLPWKTVWEEYTLEYGTAAIEMHEDACKKGDRVVIFDDLIATGGTMLAAASIVKRLGGEVVEAAAIIDLPDLGGSQKIWKTGVPVHTLSKYEGH
ncbi:MAG TPA: adenine phosphoribosyltransferase [Leptospiraceae bacterium]|jgi:adenine phosphoribosyltransferase|nr:adenine phosphoribosyltransferase [Leptospirales bacterium]HMU82531.1 adenine phosphoribosyltransferase [Leptospiraceae bacterium]HMW61740.1 adenine phosphoribosyltransferase [Leptospiraceae bacterium]HMX56732.1 adenine phosphoribosyltransferase [Leptospiraceae bacterium]HMY44852.1 adenine phosphoribosyltransferase [Leptospiraceae bacterium]